MNDEMRDEDPSDDMGTEFEEDIREGSDYDYGDSPTAQKPTKGRP